MRFHFSQEKNTESLSEKYCFSLPYQIQNASNEATKFSKKKHEKFTVTADNCQSLGNSYSHDRRCFWLRMVLKIFETFPWLRNIRPPRS